MTMDFDPILDYTADIATYRRTRERLIEVTECKHKAWMISNLDYAIEWLETGRRPGNKRGIERYAAYQREIPTDIVQRFMNPAPKLELDYTDEQRLQAEFIVSIMSERERQCYEMHYIGLYSLDDIALELDMAKGTVQTYIKRANAKVKEYRKRYIPLLDIVV